MDNTNEDLAWLADEGAPEATDDPFEPLAKGWYELTVERIEVKDNKAGTGKYINVGAVTDTNRWVWTKYNVKHSNPTAQRIGRQEFAQLCVACGFRGIVRDSSALLQRRFNGLVIIDDYFDEPQNVVKRAKPIEGANAGPAIMASEIPAGWG